ncbi:DUF1801 domain-containing protein [Gordonia bronchialis]|nr:DUF1801 domain-containing protein [Gordonia bronchialis]
MGTVDDYLGELGTDDRAVIERIYTLARDAVPGTEQGKGYGMPALIYNGKPLLSVMRAKKHIGVYPFSPAAVDAVAPMLDGFDMAKGTIRFQPTNPLSDDAVRALVIARRVPDRRGCAGRLRVRFICSEAMAHISSRITSRHDAGAAGHPRSHIPLPRFGRHRCPRQGSRRWRKGLQGLRSDRVDHHRGDHRRDRPLLLAPARPDRGVPAVRRVRRTSRARRPGQAGQPGPAVTW